MALIQLPNIDLGATVAASRPNVSDGSDHSRIAASEREAAKRRAAAQESMKAFMDSPFYQQILGQQQGQLQAQPQGEDVPQIPVLAGANGSVPSLQGQPVQSIASPDSVQQPVKDQQPVDEQEEMYKGLLPFAAQMLGDPDSMGHGYKIITDYVAYKAGKVGEGRWEDVRDPTTGTVIAQRNKSTGQITPVTADSYDVGFGYKATPAQTMALQSDRNEIGRERLALQQQIADAKSELDRQRLQAKIDELDWKDQQAKQKPVDQAAVHLANKNADYHVTAMDMVPEIQKQVEDARTMQSLLNSGLKTGAINEKSGWNDIQKYLEINGMPLAKFLQTRTVLVEQLKQKGVQTEGDAKRFAEAAPGTGQDYQTNMYALDQMINSGSKFLNKMKSREDWLNNNGSFLGYNYQAAKPVESKKEDATSESSFRYLGKTRDGRNVYEKADGTKVVR